MNIVEGKVVVPSSRVVEETIVVGRAGGGGGKVVPRGGCYKGLKDVGGVLREAIDGRQWKLKKDGTASRRHSHQQRITFTGIGTAVGRR